MTAASSGFMLGVNFRTSPVGENTICPAWTTTSFPSAFRRCQKIPTSLFWPSVAVVTVKWSVSVSVKPVSRFVCVT